MVGGIKVVLAAEVCEGAFLSELYRLALGEDGEGRGGGLLWVDFMGGKFICAEFGGDQVELKYLGKGCDQVCLLLQAG